MCVTGFPGSTIGKEPPAPTGYIRDKGLTPGLGRCPEGGHANPLQHSCLENPMNRGAWQATLRESQRVRHYGSTHAQLSESTSPNS